MLENEMRGTVMAVNSDELFGSIQERVTILAGIKLRLFSFRWHTQ